VLLEAGTIMTKYAKNHEYRFTFLQARKFQPGEGFLTHGVDKM